MQGYSHSVVAHLQWNLRQIFNLAVNEGYIQRDPAAMLFIPREAKQPIRKVMNLAEANQMIAALPLMERLIILFAILAGMRPSEIFGLTWGRLEGYCRSQARSL
jgi:integrase